MIYFKNVSECVALAALIQVGLQSRNALK